METDKLLQRLVDLAPHAQIGKGPEHPTNPDLSLAKRTATWLSVHPFLKRDAGYVEFLMRYSGVHVLTEYSSEKVAQGLDWEAEKGSRKGVRTLFRLTAQWFLG